MHRSLLRFSDSSNLKAFPKVYFDLKAFRKGISEKKQSLNNAERREIERAFAKQPPAGWTMETLLEKSNIANLKTDEGKQLISNLASCFESWNDLVSSSKKDLFRVSHLLNAEQVKKLASAIELFNHGLLGLSTTEARELFPGKPLKNSDSPWTTKEDDKLIDLAVNKYDFTFGDVWLYVSGEMERPIDQVRERFVEIYVKKKDQEKSDCEIVLSKCFKPLLMNRQFRLLPPQCYILPSGNSHRFAESEFVLPEPFRNYRNDKSF
jgi:hypothetical protein